MKINQTLNLIIIIRSNKFDYNLNKLNHGTCQLNLLMSMQGLKQVFFLIKVTPRLAHLFFSPYSFLNSTTFSSSYYKLKSVIIERAK